MSNREPSSPLLRWADVHAWLPNVTKWMMRQMREAGLITPVQVRKRSGKRRRGGRGTGLYYRKSEIKATFGLNGES